MQLQNVPCCRTETACDPTCPLHRPSQSGCQPGHPVYQTQARLGPKHSELGWAGGSKELTGDTQKRESMKAASWAPKQEERRLQGTVELGTGMAEAE